MPGFFYLFQRIVNSGSVCWFLEGYLFSFDFRYLFSVFLNFFPFLHVLLYPYLLPFLHTISPKVLTGVFISVVIKGFRALCLLKRPKKIVNNKAISLFSVARVQSCFFISALKRYLLKCLKSSKKAVWLVLLSAMYLAFWEIVNCSRWSDI